MARKTSVLIVTLVIILAGAALFGLYFSMTLKLENNQVTISKKSKEVTKIVPTKVELKMHPTLAKKNDQIIEIDNQKAKDEMINIIIDDYHDPSLNFQFDPIIMRNWAFGDCTAKDQTEVRFISHEVFKKETRQWIRLLSEHPADFEAEMPEDIQKRFNQWYFGTHTFDDDGCP